MVNIIRSHKVAFSLACSLIFSGYVETANYLTSKSLRGVYTNLKGLRLI